MCVSVTHQVSNYLPSISATISRVPERYIWRSCIGLHSAPRYLMSFAYFNFYRGRFSNKLPELLLSGLALLSSLAENTGLLLLTYVASTETYSEYNTPRMMIKCFVSLINNILLLIFTVKKLFSSRIEMINPSFIKSFSFLLVEIKSRAD